MVLESEQSMRQLQPENSACPCFLQPSMCHRPSLRSLTGFTCWLLCRAEAIVQTNYKEMVQLRDSIEAKGARMHQHKICLDRKAASLVSFCMALGSISRGIIQDSATQKETK